MDRFHIMQAVVARLYEPETRRLNNMVTQLVARNCEVRKIESACFMHNGEIFLANDMAMPPAGQRPYLDFSLRDEVAEYVSIRDKSAHNKQRIGQLITKLIEPCESLADIRNVLPECLVGICRDMFGEFDRTNEPAYNAVGNPRVQREYAKMLPVISTLAMGHMLY